MLLFLLWQLFCCAGENSLAEGFWPKKAKTQTKFLADGEMKYDLNSYVAMGL